MPTAEREGVRLHYELSGCNSDRVLLLSNSLGSTLHMWDKALPFFETRFRVLRYDTRGHGKSSIPQGCYTIEKLGTDVVFLLDHLGIEKVDFCGLSLGGLVAMWMALYAPQRLGHVILANTAARIGTREGWDERIALIETSSMAPLAQAAPGRWFTSEYQAGNPQEMQAARNMVLATNPAGYMGCCGLLRDTDMRGKISAITAPCLVIAGTHDPATPPEDLRALHRSIGNSRYLELDSSHLSAWERPEEFATGAMAFLGDEERRDG